MPEAGLGDYVLVHVGFALSKVDPEEAERTYRFLEELGQLGELEVPESRAMKYLDEYRDGRVAAKILGEIAARDHPAVDAHGGVRRARRTPSSSTASTGCCPRTIELVHGPGCPVCVTPLEQIDRAHAIAARPGVIFCSFGDMLRVPGSHTDLLRLKSEGADVRVVYSPLDAVRLAQANPDREVVFFAIGFETTAPANAMAVTRARGAGREQLLDAGVPRPRAARDGRRPAVARQPRAGVPRPRPRLHGDGLPRVRGDRRATTAFPSSSPGSSRSTCWKACCGPSTQLESGAAGVENQYSRVVRRDGNAAARSD